MGALPTLCHASGVLRCRRRDPRWTRDRDPDHATDRWPTPGIGIVHLWFATQRPVSGQGCLTCNEMTEQRPMTTSSGSTARARTRPGSSQPVGNLAVRSARFRPWSEVDVRLERPSAAASEGEAGDEGVGGGVRVELAADHARRRARRAARRRAGRRCARAGCRTAIASISPAARARRRASSSPVRASQAWCASSAVDQLGDALAARRDGLEHRRRHGSPAAGPRPAEGDHVPQVAHASRRRRRGRPC